MPVDFLSSNNGNYSATRTPPCICHVSYVPVATDVICLWVSSTVNTSTMTVPTDVAWINPLGGNTIVASDSHALACLCHVVTPAEAAAVTLTYGTTNLWDATATGDIIIMIFRGGDPSNPIDSAASTFNSSNTVTPHVIIGLSGVNLSSDSVVASGVAKDGTGTYTNPAGWTGWASANTNCGMTGQVRDAKTVAGTSVANTNITPSAGDEYCSITLAIAARPLQQEVHPVSVAVRRAGFY